MNSTPEPLKLLYLYFKALYLNKDYKDYCAAIKSGNALAVDSLQNQYPIISKKYDIWGDLYSFTDSEEHHDVFGYLLMKRGQNLLPASLKEFEFITEGQSITPKAGTIYVTLPQKTNVSIIAKLLSIEIEKTTKKLDKVLEKNWMPLVTSHWDKTDKIDITKQRLDVYYWKEHLNKSLRESLFSAYESNKARWINIKPKLDHLAEEKSKDADQKEPLTAYELKNDDIRGFLTEFSKLNAQGKAVVRNALLDKFPSTK